MTPKEKARDLFIKFYTVELYNGSHLDKEAAKECILIAVDEILNNFGSAADGKDFFTAYSTLEYWQEVKQEINNL